MFIGRHGEEFPARGDRLSGVGRLCRMGRSGRAKYDGEEYLTQWRQGAKFIFAVGSLRFRVFEEAR